MAIFEVWGEPWLSWLRHCSKRRKVPGSVPTGVLGNFQVTESLYPPAVSLESTQYQGISIGVKCGRSVELTNLPSKLCQMSK
jgi:hypothetical protein